MFEYVVSKSAVSVTEMARMVGLSRARFYQLQEAGKFPAPDRDPQSDRPYYSEDGQRICLEVRRRNFGVDGKPVLFYSRRAESPAPLPTTPTTSPRSTTSKELNCLLQGLKALGATKVTKTQAAVALAELYPAGTASAGQEQILRALFLHFRQ